MSSNAHASFGSEGEDVDRLRRELGLVTGGDSGETTEADVFAAVEETLGADTPDSVASDRVRSDLDELLLALVAVREGGTHGKGLIEGLDELFGAELSPGTVYPHLHDLADDGMLKTHELVRCKEYRMDDADGASERVAAAARQHLALGLFLRGAAAELDKQA